MVWTILPMIKQITFAATALLCFASTSFARHPFVNDPITNGPSVLVRADVPAVADLPDSASAATAVNAQAMPTAPVSGEATQPFAAADESAVGAAPMVVTQYAPVYRSSRSTRKSSNGVLGGLIELERKKNAWIRRNVFGR